MFICGTNGTYSSSEDEFAIHIWNSVISFICTCKYKLPFPEWLTQMSELPKKMGAKAHFSRNKESCFKTICPILLRRSWSKAASILHPNFFQPSSLLSLLHPLTGEHSSVGDWASDKTGKTKQRGWGLRNAVVRLPALDREVRPAGERQSRLGGTLVPEWGKVSYWSVLQWWAATNQHSSSRSSLLSAFVHIIWWFTQVDDQ